MHQARHGCHGEDCSISGLQHGEDLAPQGSSPPRHRIALLDLLWALIVYHTCPIYIKIFIGHGLRLLSQHLESDQSGDVNKCDKAEAGLFSPFFVLLFKV